MPALTFAALGLLAAMPAHHLAIAAAALMLRPIRLLIGMAGCGSAFMLAVLAFVLFAMAVMAHAIAAFALMGALRPLVLLGHCRRRQREHCKAHKSAQ